MSDTFELLMAAYPTADAASKDFDVLSAAVADKSVTTDGIILIEHAADGDVKVTHTSDHLGRKGLGWGGGVGVLVGLFNPPMLGAVVVGGAVGGLVGKFTKKKVDTGLQDNLGENLPVGAAAIIALIDPDDRLAAERALSSTPAHSVAPMDGIGELKDALAEAAGKFTPDRSRLPIPDKTFAGVAGRTMKDSVDDRSMNPGPAAPAGAPNVLVVLIDDAGYGKPDTFGGRVATPTFSRIGEMGSPTTGSTSPRSALPHAPRS